MTIVFQPGGPDTAVHVVHSMAEVTEWTETEPVEQLLVIGADVPIGEVADLAERVRSVRPETLLVLLRGSAMGTADEQDVAAAAGILEVVRDDDDDALAEACRLARELLLERTEALQCDGSERDETADGDADDDENWFETEFAEAAPEPEAVEPEPVESEAAEAEVVEVDPADTDWREPEAGLRGAVLTVFSPKGGAGTTLVATNLALALSAEGMWKVCIVDLDLEFGDVAVALRLTPARGIVDAAELDLRRPAAVEALVTRYAEGVDCVLAPVNPTDAERVSPAVVAQVITQLRAHYDYVVVDTPSQFSEPVLEVFDAADYQVLVTTPEVPALKSTRLTLDMLDLLGYGRERRFLVLNRADPKLGLSVSQAEAAIKAPITTVLPVTLEAVASINDGAPLMSGKPRDEFSIALRRFADRHITDTPLVRNDRPRRRFGLKRKGSK